MLTLCSLIFVEHTSNLPVLCYIQESEPSNTPFYFCSALNDTEIVCLEDQVQQNTERNVQEEEISAHLFVKY